MAARWKTTLALSALTLAACQAHAQVTLYADPGFEGRVYTASRSVSDFTRSGFNDRASSAVVLGNAWEVCENSGFGGRCRVLRPGRYPSLEAMGLNDRISSMRPVTRQARIADDRYAPPPEAAYDNRRRPNERLFQADVTAVHAVVGTAGQRCWMERERVSAPQNDNRVAGGVLGAVLGGVLGHQVGGGRGKDLATVGGAVAGGVIGSQMGRGDDGGTREVQRCAPDASAARPAYWDVSYRFRGQDHQVQMTTQPGRTITVNKDGEPRA